MLWRDGCGAISHCRRRCSGANCGAGRRGSGSGGSIRFGPFVIDFYCASAKLAVEVDGAAHGMGDRPERDLERAEFLAAQGIALIRVAAVEVLRNPQGVAEAVAAACCERGG